MCLYKDLTWLWHVQTKDLGNRKTHNSYYYRNIATSIFYFEYVRFWTQLLLFCCCIWIKWVWQHLSVHLWYIFIKDTLRIHLSIKENILKAYNITSEIYVLDNKSLHFVSTCSHFRMRCLGNITSFRWKISRNVSNKLG